MKEAQPDFSRLRERLDLRHSLIGLFDAPDPNPFGPLVTPGPGECVFAFFQDWLNGKTLHLTQDRFGCGGCGRWMFDVMTRKREDFISFLVDSEGLKASRELMEEWIDASQPYQRQHPHILIGPLEENQWEHCRTVTFFIDADQLSALVYGAHYHSAPDDPPPLIAPFGSGCMELAPFRDLSLPQAAIGATDIAMRQHLPPEILAVTVTRSMFQRLCSLDEHSFLYKPFLKKLKSSRRKRPE
ncbi:MAG: DUF169 domain-containing protein [Candidatus Aminicenantaceae bacterium]